MNITAYPLHWPTGWRRTTADYRAYGRFAKRESVKSGFSDNYYTRTKHLTVAEAVQRVLNELERLGVVRDDVVISTNIQTRLDGLPRSDQRRPDDPGAAVYWRQGHGTPHCMAVDRYTDVADNLAAIAATLDAMRAIERHGGAPILDRVFEGFTALPSPESWWQVLGLDGPDVTSDDIHRAWRRKISNAHPDKGGDAEQAARINRARDQGMDTI